MEIKALTCPNCGAKATKEKMKCDYCGADLIVTNMRRAIVQCLYLLDGKYCKLMGEGGEGKILREELCRNVMHDSCCYVCDRHDSCEIGCDFPYKPENATQEDTD
jgi:hypothetical protein